VTAALKQDLEVGPPSFSHTQRDKFKQSQPVRRWGAVGGTISLHHNNSGGKLVRPEGG